MIFDQKELKKAHPKKDLVQLRREKTLADGHQWIVREKPSMEAIQEAWPWLFQDQQVSFMDENYPVSFLLLYISH